MKNKRFGRVRHRENDISQYYVIGGQGKSKWMGWEGLDWGEEVDGFLIFGNGVGWGGFWGIYDVCRFWNVRDEWKTESKEGFNIFRVL